MTHDTRCRLLLAHPGEPDRWAAAVGVVLRLSPYQVRGLARAVAVEGDGPATRLHILFQWDRLLPAPLIRFTL